MRGQSLVCLFLGLWYGIGLTLIGLDFGFLIGVIGGVLSFVPYVGSLTVLVLSLDRRRSCRAGRSWNLFVLALGIVGVGQFLEGNVLSPKLVGESIGLHPVWLMFALLAFGELFGFTGLLVAVPMAAALGVVARHFCSSISQPALSRRRAGAGAVTDRPRQLTLDWPHADELCARRFSGRARKRGGAAADRSWPRWPSPCCCWSAREGRARAISARSGRGGARAP